MSIWSQISGTVNTSKSRHISIRKLVGEVFQGDDYSLSLLPSVVKEEIIEFEMNFCDDGDSAIKQFKKLVKALEDVKVGYDFNLNVRFIGG